MEIRVPRSDEEGCWWKSLLRMLLYLPGERLGRLWIRLSLLQGRASLDCFPFRLRDFASSMRESFERSRQAGLGGMGNIVTNIASKREIVGIDEDDVEFALGAVVCERQEAI